MFNTGSTKDTTGASNANAGDGGPSSLSEDSARKELARYKAGLNFRRGYLTCLKEVYTDTEQYGIERRADLATRRFLEEFR